jgi:hypothetical protein
VYNLLGKLQKVKENGRDSWMACCPAHDDKNPSLKVSLVDDKILIHCWTGCEVEDVLGAVGMDFDDIFPDKPLYHRSSGKAPMLSSADALRIVKYEAAIIMMYGQDLRAGKKPSDEDHARFVTAVDRVGDAMEAAGVKL